MRRVRRFDPEGCPVFITQVCKGRASMLQGLETLILSVMHELRCESGYRIYAHVILPDHMHLLVGRGHGFSRFMQSLKLRVVRRAGRGRFWQERFLDHVIRDEVDLRNHLDYLHYNPVRHGHAATPEGHPYSSFRRYQAHGWYMPGWGNSLPGNIEAIEMD